MVIAVFDNSSQAERMKSLKCFTKITQLPSSGGQQLVLNDNTFRCKHLEIYLSFISLATKTLA